MRLANRVIWRQRNRQTSRSTKNSDLTELWIHGNRRAACDCGHSAIPRLKGTKRVRAKYWHNFRFGAFFGPMARPLRIEYPGAIYHVLSRGDRRAAIFRRDADRKLFLDLLGLTCRRSFTIAAN